MPAPEYNQVGIPSFNTNFSGINWTGIAPAWNEAIKGLQLGIQSSAGADLYKALSGASNYDEMVAARRSEEFQNALKNASPEDRKNAFNFLENMARIDETRAQTGVLNESARKAKGENDDIEFMRTHPELIVDWQKAYKSGKLPQWYRWLDKQGINVPGTLLAKGGALDADVNAERQKIAAAYASNAAAKASLASAHHSNVLSNIAQQEAFGNFVSQRYQQIYVNQGPQKAIEFLESAAQTLNNPYTKTIPEKSTAAEAMAYAKPPFSTTSKGASEAFTTVSNDRSGEIASQAAINARNSGNPLNTQEDVLHAAGAQLQQVLNSDLPAQVKTQAVNNFGKAFGVENLMGQQWLDPDAVHKRAQELKDEAQEKQQQRKADIEEINAQRNEAQRQIDYYAEQMNSEEGAHNLAKAHMANPNNYSPAVQNVIQDLNNYNEKGFHFENPSFRPNHERNEHLIDEINKFRSKDKQLSKKDLWKQDSFETIAKALNELPEDQRIEAISRAVEGNNSIYNLKGDRLQQALQNAKNPINDADQTVPLSPQDRKAIEELAKQVTTANKKVDRAKVDALGNVLPEEQLRVATSDYLDKQKKQNISYDLNTREGRIASELAKRGLNEQTAPVELKNFLYYSDLLGRLHPTKQQEEGKEALTKNSSKATTDPDVIYNGVGYLLNSGLLKTSEDCTTAYNNLDRAEEQTLLEINSQGNISAEDIIQAREQNKSKDKKDLPELVNEKFSNKFSDKENNREAKLAYLVEMINEIMPLVGNNPYLAIKCAEKAINNQNFKIMPFQNYQTALDFDMSKMRKNAEDIRNNGAKLVSDYNEAKSKYAAAKEAVQGEKERLEGINPLAGLFQTKGPGIQDLQDIKDAQRVLRNLQRFGFR